jgi:hypothetical protein
MNYLELKDIEIRVTNRIVEGLWKELGGEGSGFFGHEGGVGGPGNPGGSQSSGGGGDGGSKDKSDVFSTEGGGSRKEAEAFLKNLEWQPTGRFIRAINEFESTDTPVTLKVTQITCDTKPHGGVPLAVNFDVSAKEEGQDRGSFYVSIDHEGIPSINTEGSHPMLGESSFHDELLNWLYQYAKSY